MQVLFLVSGFDVCGFFFKLYSSDLHWQGKRMSEIDVMVI